ncbi:unnamed protein product [Gongylonema pulchrum]|uniref:CHM2A protein n=1 Tax=Gongylonema pulchrum TaxID=637853 RepID=A0A183F1N7_9BILA|nr:unnamed protein product [Gongylonema pulchrum]
MFEYAMKMQKEMEAMEKAGKVAGAASGPSPLSTSPQTDSTQADLSSSPMGSDKDLPKRKRDENQETSL